MHHISPRFSGQSLSEALVNSYFCNRAIDKSANRVKAETNGIIQQQQYQISILQQQFQAMQARQFQMDAFIRTIPHSTATRPVKD